MGKTAIVKIMERASGHPVEVGDRGWCNVELASAGDFGGANCVLQFEQEMAKMQGFGTPIKSPIPLTCRHPLIPKKFPTIKKLFGNSPSGREFVICLILITASDSMSCWNPGW